MADAVASSSKAAVRSLYRTFSRELRLGVGMAAFVTVSVSLADHGTGTVYLSVSRHSL